MFVDLVVRSSPPSIDDLTANGRFELTLPELVINRRHWKNYRRYLSKIYSDSFSPNTVSGLRDMIWNCVLELAAFEKGVEFKLDHNQSSIKVNTDEGEKDENKEGNEDRKKTEITAPPTVNQLLEKCMPNDLLLKEAVKCRQMWMKYVNELDKDKSMASEKKHANEERWEYDNFIDQLLDTMYCLNVCSEESEHSNDSDSDTDEEGCMPPRKKYCLNDFGRFIALIKEYD